MSFEKVQIGDCPLSRADCMEVLPTLGAGSVDAVVTDPPYGVRYAGWDDRRPPDEFFDEIRRITPCAAVHAPQGEIWDWPKPDWIMAWFMPGSVNRTKAGKFRHWEPVLIYGEERAWVDSRVFPPIGAQRNGHPCPKPDAIEEWLVQALSGAGDLICDPMMGSGTTGVVCIRTGRKFIGIEIDKGYFETACKRIQTEWDLRQGSGPLIRQSSIVNRQLPLEAAV